MLLHTQTQAYQSSVTEILYGGREEKWLGTWLLTLMAGALLPITASPHPMQSFHFRLSESAIKIKLFSVLLQPELFSLACQVDHRLKEKAYYGNFS